MENINVNISDSKEVRKMGEKSLLVEKYSKVSWKALIDFTEEILKLIRMQFELEWKLNEEFNLRDFLFSLKNIRKSRVECLEMTSGLSQCHFYCQ